MAEAEHPTHHNQGQAPADAHEEPKKFVAKLAQRSFALGMLAGIVGGGVYLLSQCHRQPPASASMPTPQNTPTVAPNPIALTTPTIQSTPTAPPASTPQSTPLASSSATPVPPPPAKDPFEDGMQRVLQAGNSGFRELRGILTKTENATGPYPLFRLRKIYEGAFIFGGAYAAQLEEVYYSNANQPAYNYHLYFQGSSDKGPRYNDLRGRLDVMLRDFVHTSGTGYDAWTSSDARGTAVLLTDRDVLGSVEVKVHVAFPKPHRWNPPVDELHLIAQTVGRVLEVQGHETIRDVLGDVDALEETVDRLQAYERFHPDRFNRGKINRRLKQYAQGDEGWRWE